MLRLTRDLRRIEKYILIATHLISIECFVVDVINTAIATVIIHLNEIIEWPISIGCRFHRMS